MNTNARTSSRNNRREETASRVARRRKIAIWAALVAVVSAGAFMYIPQATAQSEVISTVSYTVQPNDTLWEYAMRITPAGGDVYDTMTQIKRINHMDSDQLTAGQTLLVPEA